MSAPFASADNENLDSILDGIGDAVCVTDGELNFVAANRHYAAFYGLDDPGLLVGKSAFEVYPGFKQSVFYEACEITSKTGKTTTRLGYSANLMAWVVMRCYKLRDNRFVMVVHRLADDSSTGNYAPSFDTLTSLPNRWTFERDMERMLRYKEPVALVLVDISHFKQLNETLGFEAGDRCLMEVAARMKRLARQADRVYRVGSDQFLILVGGRPEQPGVYRSLVQEGLGVPLQLGEGEYVLQFNIGVNPGDERDTVSQALTKAERALAYAKSHKTGYAEYSEKIAGKLFNPAMTKAIRDAISKDELCLYLQPLIDAIDEKPYGAEALLRWRHPERGLVTPMDFLPFAEETGLIGEIDRVVVGKACEAQARLARAGFLMSVSFNLSAQSICDPGIVEVVAEQVQRSGVDARMLCVEITETSLMQDADTSQRVIEQLKEMGLRVAIDDFGSGYSSMSYLLRYPSHYLKIDREFVRNLATSPSHQVIVRNMIGLAHGLQIATVAEGVEDRETYLALREMECDMLQGYLYAQAMPQEKFEAWVGERGAGNLASGLLI